MRILLCFFLLVVYQLSVGQSLTIEETIAYINELSKTSAEEYERFDCTCKNNDDLSLSSDGLIKIISYQSRFDCKSATGNGTFSFWENSFHYSDIDINKIRIDQTIGWIIIPCKNEATNI